MRGDINGDQIIDVSDLTYLSLYLVGDYNFSAKEYESADIDSDSDIRLTDLAMLRQYISKIPGVYIK